MLDFLFEESDSHGALDARVLVTPAKRQASMTWAHRLKLVFNIDIQSCNECGSTIQPMTGKQNLSAA
jgi:hypothetical protein